MMKAFIQSTDKNLQALTQSIDKFVQATNKNIQELKNATMANSKDIHKLKSFVDRIEGKISHLVTELNRIEEEELQSQLMIERHYMSDEDDSEILIMNIPKSPPHLMRMKSWIMKRSKLSTMSELSTMRKVSPQQILIYPMTWK
jgi:chromosome segregation ATPase